MFQFMGLILKPRSSASRTLLVAEFVPILTDPEGQGLERGYLGRQTLTHSNSFQKDLKWNSN